MRPCGFLLQNQPTGSVEVAQGWSPCLHGRASAPARLLEAPDHLCLRPVPLLLLYTSSTWLSSFSFLRPFCFLNIPSLKSIPVLISIVSCTYSVLSGDVISQLQSCEPVALGLCLCWYLGLTSQEAAAPTRVVGSQVRAPHCFLHSEPRRGPKPGSSRSACRSLKSPRPTSSHGKGPQATV